MGQAISKLTIKGYKSIRNLENFELRNINILIGPNGAGKSNFLSFFELVKTMLSENWKEEISKLGRADRLFYMGSKITKNCKFKLHCSGGITGFNFSRNLTTNPEDELIIDPQRPGMGSGEHTRDQDIVEYFNIARKTLVKGIYHFHDTSDFAGIKRPNSEGNFDYLFPDASNLAPFLFRLKNKQPRDYQNIIDVIRLAAPFFKNFKFDINEQDGDVKWWWSQKGSDYQFHPSQISDGTLRFICLATVLLQPDPPSTILLDEPELGLHPYALTLLAGLIQKASHRTQVIVSTQSASLINHFEPEDIVIVERQNGESTFKRLIKTNLKVWLEEYSLGELWQKNVLGGRPARE